MTYRCVLVDALDATGQNEPFAARHARRVAGAALRAARSGVLGPTGRLFREAGVLAAHVAAPVARGRAREGGGEAERVVAVVAGAAQEEREAAPRVPAQLAHLAVAADPGLAREDLGLGRLGQADAVRVEAAVARLAREEGRAFRAEHLRAHTREKGTTCDSNEEIKRPFSDGDNEHKWMGQQKGHVSK